MADEDNNCQKKRTDYSFGNLDSEKMATLNIGTSSHHYMNMKGKGLMFYNFLSCKLIQGDRNK